MKAATSRALEDVRLGVSISESAGSEDLGFDGEEVNRTVERLCRGMLAQGAGLIFGHDWRAEGVMERVLGFAQTYQQSADVEPRLINLIPWPDGPTLSQDERDFLSDVLRIERTGLPPTLAGKEEQALEDHPGGRAYLRARALTRLRRELTDRCNARVCLGGKTQGYQGRLPGIVEEALFALEAGRPLYLSAIFGGATADTINALSGRPMPSDPWEPAGGLADDFAVYANQTEPAEPDAALDPPAVWQRLADIGLKKLAEDNGLSADENERLFSAQSTSVVIDWIVVGLTRLRVRSGG